MRYVRRRQIKKLENCQLAYWTCHIEDGLKNKSIHYMIRFNKFWGHLSA